MTKERPGISPSLAGLSAACALAVSFSLGDMSGGYAQERTTATYGHWELRCERNKAEAEPVEACEIVQAIQLQGQSQPFAQIAIGRPEPEASLLMVVQLPIGVWLPAGVRIELGENEASQEAVLKRCVPSACLADLTLDEAMTSAMSADPKGQGAIVFATGEGREATLPIYFDGFDRAYRALLDRLEKG